MLSSTSGGMKKIFTIIVKKHIKLKALEKCRPPLRQMYMYFTEGDYAVFIIWPWHNRTLIETGTKHTAGYEQ